MGRRNGKSVWYQFTLCNIHPQKGYSENNKDFCTIGKGRILKVSCRRWRDIYKKHHFVHPNLRGRKMRVRFAKKEYLLPRHHTVWEWRIKLNASGLKMRNWNCLSFSLLDYLCTQFLSSNSWRRKIRSFIHGCLFCYLAGLLSVFFGFLKLGLSQSQELRLHQMVGIDILFLYLILDPTDHMKLTYLSKQVCFRDLESQ